MHRTVGLESVRSNLSNIESIGTEMICLLVRKDVLLDSGCVNCSSGCGVTYLACCVLD